MLENNLLDITIMADIDNTRAESKMTTNVVEYLEVETAGIVKVKLGTEIFVEFEEIDCEGPLMVVDIEEFISVM